MEAKHPMHTDNVRDDIVRQHDVEVDIAELFIVASQVCQQAVVEGVH